LKQLDIPAYWGRPEVALDRQPVKIQRCAGGRKGANTQAIGRPDREDRQLCQKRGNQRPLEAEHRNAAAHGLREHRLVSRLKLLAVRAGLPLDGAPRKKWANPRNELAVFFGPECQAPFLAASLYKDLYSMTDRGRGSKWFSWLKHDWRLGFERPIISDADRPHRSAKPVATVPFTCNSTPEPYDPIFLLRRPVPGPH
jgi:hypothetical protein